MAGNQAETSQRSAPLRSWGRRLLGSSLRNLVLGALFVLTISGIGMAGYIEAGWSVSDAVYMVVITIFTVGYDEIRPVNTPFLRADTIFLIVLGCTGMIFQTGALIQFITITQFQQLFGTRRMKNDIDALTSHVIICGYGRIGLMLAQELATNGARFVILERSDRRFAEARDAGFLCIQSDASEETALMTAGIDRARCLATVLPDDAVNVFIALTARSLSPTIEIIARGEAATTESKLRLAGATRVVMPTQIGAERIAQMILAGEPGAVHAPVRGMGARRESEEVLADLGLSLHRLVVVPDSPYRGLTLTEAEQHAGISMIVVALKSGDGDTVDQPPLDTRLKAGDVALFIGREGQRLAPERRRTNARG
jgi:Trk K+ transport system NAD-binding subunit